MGAPRARTGSALAASQTRGSAAALLDFAVTQILRDETTLGALPAVLERLAAISGARTALAFQGAGTGQGAGAGQSAAAGADQSAGPGAGPILAVHPAGSVDPALLAKVSAMTMSQRDAGTDPRAAGTPVQVTLEVNGQPASVLLAYSTPVGGQCLCALALIGDPARWDEEIRAAMHAIATIVATQIRHANDLAEIAERQALTRTLIEKSPTAILAMDEDGRLVEFNPAAEWLSGFRREQALGREMAELLVSPARRARLRAHIRTYVATGDPGEFTGPRRLTALRADGTERAVELTPVQARIDDQVYFIAFLRDLTEIERSHAALADQTERLNCLINTAIPGVLITDEQGAITHISESFGAMFGIGEPAALVGTHAVAVIRRIGRQFADPREFTRRVIAIFRAREPTSGQQIMSADGRTIECDYWPVLVDGRYRGDLWLAWDMSDRKELEERLAEQNERLRKIDEARNQFLSIVSHELRTPLTSILSFSELIRSEAGGLTPEGLSFLDIIERNADRLHRLVGDLLMLDRLEAGALPLDLASVDIGALCLEAVSAASAGAAKQGIAVELTTGTGPPVRGDARRLAQVLDNLIANAVKFSHRDTQVRVAATWDSRKRQWRVDVADKGIGIPPDEADQLFSRFVRASNARTAGLPGTGLGLSIVKVLVELHGGHVEVVSAQGRGSTFSVFLPVPQIASPA